MIITNKFNLPQVLVKAAEGRVYDPGQSDITVTSLKDPGRITALKKQLNGHLSEDVADNAYSLLGSAVHAMLEWADDGARKEERNYIDVLGWKVGGQFDHFLDGTLTDFKVTSAYNVKGHLSGEKDDWPTQLNVLAAILRENGEKVEKLRVIAVLRDWSKPEAQREAKFAKENNTPIYYPQHQIQVLEFPIWGHDATLNWINERVRYHQEACANIPACSKEDRWETEEKWAVMKGQNKRATKLHNSQAEAEEHAAREDALWVQHRPGEPKRCDLYCPVKAYCSQRTSELIDPDLMWDYAMSAVEGITCPDVLDGWVKSSVFLSRLPDDYKSRLWDTIKARKKELGNEQPAAA